MDTDVNSSFQYDTSPPVKWINLSHNQNKVHPFILNDITFEIICTNVPIREFESYKANTNQLKQSLIFKCLINNIIIY